MNAANAGIGLIFGGGFGTLLGPMLDLTWLLGLAVGAAMGLLLGGALPHSKPIRARTRPTRSYR
jgi:hypothetical protein